MNKNLKVAIFDPDLDDEFLFGIEFFENKISVSYSKENVPFDFMATVKDFGMSFDVMLHILYCEYIKDSSN